MHHNVNGLVMVVLFGLGIAAGLVSGAAYLNRPKYHKQGEKHASANDAQGADKSHSLNEEDFVLKRSDLNAQWTMAFGTLALFALTLASIGVTGWYSHRSLRETKRSVDTVISKEIGYIAIRDFARIGEHVHVTWKNHGPSLIHLTGFDYRWQVAPNEKSAHSGITRNFAENTVVPPNETFGTDETSPSFHGRPLEMPDVTIEALKKNPEWQNILTMDFMYDSPFGVYHKRITVIIDEDGGIVTSLYDGLHYNLSHAQFIKRFGLD